MHVPGAHGLRVGARRKRALRRFAFYAVRKGRHVDRQKSSWGECVPHPGAKFKGFRTLVEAEDSLGDLNKRFNVYLTLEKAPKIQIGILIIVVFLS